VPKEWLCSLRCFAKFDVDLLFQKACLCSLNLMARFFRFGLCKLYRNLGMSVYTLPSKCICLRGCVYGLLHG
jgi:hypothetical protein